MTAVSATFLAARVWIRLKSDSRLRLDDHLVVAAWLMLLLSAVLWEVKGGLLYWMYDVQYGRRPPSPEFVPAYATFMPLVFVWSVLYPSCLWAVKFSFLVFFRRLGFQVNQNKGWWWSVSAIAAGGWVVSVADIDFRCTLADITYIMGGSFVCLLQ